MTLDKEARAVVEAEIRRLEKREADAQERYGITGSRSSERSMRKYRILRETLESAATDKWQETIMREYRELVNQMILMESEISVMVRTGRIPFDAANALLAIRRGETA